MQKVKIPVRLDPGRSATKQLTFDGVIPLSALSRLADMAIDDGCVEVALACDRDEQHFARLAVSLQCDLELQCQRCNEPFIHHVAIEVVYSPIKDEDASDHLPADYEPILVSDDDDVNLHQLIEDEILLALPYVPMHELSECKQSAETSWGEVDDAQEERPNPFAVLSKLKNSEE